MYVCIIISSLNQPYGDAWEWITVREKQGKKRYSKITGQHEKSHTQLFKNQSSDRKKIVSASQCGILASGLTSTLSFAS